MILANFYNSITNTRGQINAVLSVAETSSVYGYGSEPVSLAEVKTYCKIDFDDEDELLEELIISAREELEKYCGLSFIPKRLTVQLQNDCGGIEIPYGPVYGTIDTTLITDSADDEVSIDILGGSDYPYIVTPINYVQLIYDAGFIVLPTVLKTAIKAQVFYLYENRGENPDLDYICKDAVKRCAKYRRVWDIM